MAILVQSNKKPRLTFPTLTGSIVTFNSQYAGLPLKSHIVEVVATQSGSGTSSPDNVRSISGYSKINIGNAIAYDTNIEQGTLDSNGLNGNATNRIRTADYIPVVSGHTYKITLIGSGAYYLGVSGYTANDYATARTQNTAWLGNNTDLLIDAGVNYIRINVRFANSTYITPADLTGILVTDITNYHTIQIGSTVYGGEYDARTGVLTVTHGVVDLGSLTWVYRSNGLFRTPIISGMKTEYLPDWNCEIYSVTTTANYSGWDDKPNNTIGFLSTYGHFMVRDDRYTDANDLKTALNGMKLVYELATPTTIQLPPCPIDTLEGVNNIWADTGDTTLQYPKFG